MLTSGNPQEVRRYLASLNETASVKISDNLVCVLALLLNAHPSARPNTYQLLASAPWINDPKIKMSEQDYQAAMKSFFMLKLQAGVQPVPQKDNTPILKADDDASTCLP